jgi:hypothetical protein
MIMNKKHILFALAAVAVIPLVNCGDNASSPDARTKKDGNGSGSNFPPAPALGAQIDRMGRPAINTALNHAFDPDPTMASKGAAKDAYNQDTSIATWAATYVPGRDNFAYNLGLIDAVDGGLNCLDGACSSAVGSGGCGNQVLYNGVLTGGGTAAADSYTTLAAILADDELYVDTTKGTCGLYLAVEFGFASSLGNQTCGGRAPSYDVMGVSYTALGIGLTGFKTSDGSFTPFVSSGVTGVSFHTDTSDAAFPFLGAPH